MLIALLAEIGIAAPAIGVGGFAALEVVVDEADQRVGGDTADQTKPNPAAALAALLHGAGNDRFGSIREAYADRVEWQECRR